MHSNEHTSEHAHEEHHDVQDTIITRSIGIALALGICYGLHTIAPSMGWHGVVPGILTGVTGVIMGAGGTSTNGPMLAAILGWAGATNFILGILLFVF